MHVRVVVVVSDRAEEDGPDGVVMLGDDDDIVYCIHSREVRQQLQPKVIGCLFVECNCQLFLCTVVLL